VAVDSHPDYVLRITLLLFLNQVFFSLFTRDLPALTSFNSTTPSLPFSVTLLVADFWLENDATLCVDF
jgi:hypothetical protein